jgi:hypothetical protein
MTHEQAVKALLFETLLAGQAGNYFNQIKNLPLLDDISNQDGQPLEREEALLGTIRECLVNCGYTAAELCTEVKGFEDFVRKFTPSEVYNLIIGSEDLDNLKPNVPTLNTLERCPFFSLLIKNRIRDSLALTDKIENTELRSLVDATHRTMNETSSRNFIGVFLGLYAQQFSSACPSQGTSAGK